MSFKLRISFIAFSLMILCGSIFSPSPTPARGDAPYVSWSNIGMGYGNGINTVAFRRNSVLTEGDYQFAAYYDTDGTAVVARRLVADNSPALGPRSTPVLRP